jgi:hypothetical protein
MTANARPIPMPEELAFAVPSGQDSIADRFA